MAEEETVMAVVEAATAMAVVVARQAELAVRVGKSHLLTWRCS